MTDALPLCIDSLAVAYDRDPVLEGVSFDLSPGSSLAVVGPNGAGKSTLLRAILGLAPVTSGSVSVLGLRPRDARRHVAYVPQADALDPEFPIDAFGVVLQGRYRQAGWLRRPGKADREAARTALAEVGLTEQARHRFGTLSGGQRQRVLLARAIAQDARLLLLDEPFNGVDSASQQSLIDVMDRMRADGVAIVISTHDLAFAHLACSEACLINGHMVGFGTPHQVLTPEHLATAYGPSIHAVDHGGTVISAHTH
jgi:manganese/iron transport system ATP-binding protein